jgi:hypothetical protein
MYVISALVGGSDVGEGGDSHADVPGHDRGETTDQERDRRVELAHLDLRSQGDQNCEHDEENAEEDIFLL